VLGICRTFIYLIDKYCETCGKKITFRIINVLYSRFCEKYYEKFKRTVDIEKISDYKEEFYCKDCGNFINAEEIAQFKAILKNFSKIYIKGRCSGPEKHKISVELLNPDKSWMVLIPDLINKCNSCNSSDIFFKELNFYYFDFETRSDIFDRQLVKFCKACKDVKKVLMHHQFYEVYRRIMKDKGELIRDKSELNCPTCESEVLLEKLILKKDIALIHMICKEKHKIKIEYDISRKNDWINTIILNIDKCTKCWAHDQRLIAIKIKWHYSLRDQNSLAESHFVIQCRNCNNKRDIKLDNLVFDEVLDYFSGNTPNI
jgi:hypothetical protein